MIPFVKQPALLALLLFLVGGRAEPARDGRRFLGSSNSSSAGAAVHREREGRYLNLLQVVQFKQDQCCTGTDGQLGSCLTPEECDSESNGRRIGNCAAGFGTCCQVVHTSSGSTVNRNCSYVRNPEYPAFREAAGTFSWTVDRTGPDICFIRLDFDSVQVSGPDLTLAGRGYCRTDTLAFTQGSGYPVGTLCGTLTGSHLYLDAGGLDNYSPITLTHTLTGAVTTATRRWSYRVSYIECSSRMRPPRGCAQYLTGVSGRLETYNYEGATPFHLNSMFYTICLRQEKGYCSIRYGLPKEKSDPFHISDQDAANVLVARNGQNCFNDYVIIPRSRHSSQSPTEQLCTVRFNGADIATRSTDRYCSGILSCTRNAIASTPAIIQEGPPFEVRICLNEQDEVATDGRVNLGVVFDYKQIPC